MKARNSRTGHVISGKIAEILVRTGAAREIGNSANLKKSKQEQEEIIEEPLEQVEETTIVEEVKEVEEIIEEPVKNKKGRNHKK